MQIRKLLQYFNVTFLVLLLNFQFLEFHIVSKLIIAWGISYLLLSWQNLKKINLKVFIPHLWVLPLFVSIIYSTDYYYGFKKIINYLPLIIFPLLLSLKNNNIEDKTYDIVRYIFPVGTIAFGLYVIFKIYYFFYDPYVIQYGAPRFSEYLFFVYEHRFGYLVNKDEIEVFSQEFHKAYYSIALLISIILASTWSKRVFRFFTILITIVLLLIFKSIPAYFALISIGIIFFYWKRKKKLLLILSLFFLLIIFIFKHELLHNFFETRVLVYNCSLEMFLSEPIFGYGIGDVNNILEKCYLEKQCVSCIGLNSHNEFFNVALSSGLFGLILFVIFLFYSFKTSMKNIPLLAFLTIFSISFMFENVLSRMWGVLMFSFFYSFFKITMRGYLNIEKIK